MYHPSQHPSQMTNEIAFRLGKGEGQKFYDSAMWRPNLEDFPLCHFFDWKLTSLSFGSLDGKDWDIHLNGTLKPEKFETIEHKLHYLRGRLSSYSVIIIPDSLSISYANSYASRDLWAKWAREVIENHFGWGRKTFEIITGELCGTVPGSPYVILKADKEIIDFIKG